MNKTELIESVALEAGLSKADAKRALDAFVSTTSKTLKSGGKVACLERGFKKELMINSSSLQSIFETILWWPLHHLLLCVCH